MANEAVESGAAVVTMVIESRSPHETKLWGRRLASLLEGGELLGLIGDLGAGKTCFIKGLASGLSLREEDILSPTFTMIQEHSGRVPLYHIDLYRLEKPGELDSLGLEDLMQDERNLLLIEWGEKFPRILQQKDAEIVIRRVEHDERTVRLTTNG